MADAKTARLKTPVFRVCFPALFSHAPQMANSTGKPAYEVTAVFDPTKFTPDEKKLWDALKASANAACIEKFKKPLKDIALPNFHKPFIDGAAKEHLEGFGAGLIYSKFKTWTRPGVVGPDGRTPLTDPEQVYAGCYARATVGPYAFDKGGGKGVRFALNNLMFVRDGAHLDGRTNAEDDFGEDATTDDNDLM